MSKKITKFSRSFWETAVAYGGSDEVVLRNYDIIQDSKKGLSCRQIAIKHGLSHKHVLTILHKYE